MITILNNADFSQNNLGKINISNILSDFTKTILTKMTKYTNDSEAAFELDVFYNTLVEKGIFAKINHLYLPVFASTLSECFYNIAKNSGAYDLNTFSHIELDANNGIAQTTEGDIYPSTAQNVINLANNINAYDYTLVLFSLSKNIPGTICYKSNRAMGLGGNTLTNIGINPGGDGPGYVSSLVDDGVYAGLSSSSVIDTYPFNSGFASFTKNTTKEFIQWGGTIKEKDGTTPLIATLNKMFIVGDKFVPGQTTGNNHTPISPLSNGCYMVSKVAFTQQEVNAFASALETLMVNIGYSNVDTFYK